MLIKHSFSLSSSGKYCNASNVFIFTLHYIYYELLKIFNTYETVHETVGLSFTHRGILLLLLYLWWPNDDNIDIVYWPLGEFWMYVFPLGYFITFVNVGLFLEIEFFFSMSWHELSKFVCMCTSPPLTGRYKSASPGEMCRISTVWTYVFNKIIVIISIVIVIIINTVSVVISFIRQYVCSHSLADVSHSPRYSLLVLALMSQLLHGFRNRKKKKKKRRLAGGQLPPVRWFERNMTQTEADREEVTTRRLPVWTNVCVSMTSIHPPVETLHRARTHATCPGTHFALTLLE